MTVALPGESVGLWPDDILRPPLTNPPVAILKEQAAILARRTKNTLKGDVLKIKNSNPPAAFGYAFYVAAPGIDYRYSLFTLRHKIDFYPLTIESSDTEIFSEIPKAKMIAGMAVEVADEADLKATLRLIFNSEKTRKILLSLLSLAGYENQGDEDPF